MIITCEQCQTRFKVPDKKLAAGPIRMRCSKCNHVFSAGGPASAPPPSGPNPFAVPAPPTLSRRPTGAFAASEQAGGLPFPPPPTGELPTVAVANPFLGAPTPFPGTVPGLGGLRSSTPLGATPSSMPGVGAPDPFAPLASGQFASGQFASGQVASGQFASGQVASGQFAAAAPDPFAALGASPPPRASAADPFAAMGDPFAQVGRVPTPIASLDPFAQLTAPSSQRSASGPDAWNDVGPASGSPPSAHPRDAVADPFAALATAPAMAEPFAALTAHKPSTDTFGALAGSPPSPTVDPFSSLAPPTTDPFLAASSGSMDTREDLPQAPPSTPDLELDTSFAGVDLSPPDEGPAEPPVQAPVAVRQPPAPVPTTMAPAPVAPAPQPARRKPAAGLGGAVQTRLLLGAQIAAAVALLVGAAVVGRGGSFFALAHGDLLGALALAAPSGQLALADVRASRRIVPAGIDVVVVSGVVRNHTNALAPGVRVEARFASGAVAVGWAWANIDALELDAIVDLAGLDALAARAPTSPVVQPGEEAPFVIIARAPPEGMTVDLTASVVTPAAKLTATTASAAEAMSTRGP